jgi:hypothetical protein
MTQANGFGGIVAQTSCANDIPAVYYTTGTGAGESVGTTTYASAKPNSELTTQMFTEGQVQVRIVGCGLRIRFIGRQIDMNGRAFALEEPSHRDTINFTVPQVQRYDRCKSKPFSRKWVVATWQPVRPGEQAYHDNAFGATDDSHDEPLCILLQAQSGVQCPFEWEYFCHYEAVGEAARGKTRSHIAPIAGPKAIAALQRAPTEVYDAVSNHEVSTAKLANAAITQGSSFDWSGNVQETAFQVARTAVGAVTSRAAAQYMAGGLMAIL